MEVRLNPDSSERYGLTAGHVRRAATTLFRGAKVGEVYEGQKKFDVVVWGVPKVRADLTAIRARRPGVKIVGIEPTGSPTLKACLDAGHLVALPEVTSRVPTMSCRQTDQRIYETVRDTVDDIVLVTDDAMEDASRWLWFEMGVAADLSGAASLAALRQGVPALAGARHICALVCGAGAEGTA